VKLRGLWPVAIISTAGLVALIAFTAVSSSDGAPRGSVLAAPAKVLPTLIDAEALGDCTTTGGAGPSSIRMSGSCSGLLTASFGCVRAGDLQAISIRQRAGRGLVFYLTIVIPEFEGPGHYSQDVASAQVIGPANTPRWTTSGSHIAIEVTPDGVFELGQGVLLPEPGTPATGVITLEGRAVCR
jgi:hypothetical protein